MKSDVLKVYSEFFSPFFSLHFLFFLITAKRFKISYSGFLCSFRGQGGQLLKNFLCLRPAILLHRGPPPIVKACVFFQ